MRLWFRSHQFLVLVCVLLCRNNSVRHSCSFNGAIDPVVQACANNNLTTEMVSSNLLMNSPILEKPPPEQRSLMMRFLSELKTSAWYLVDFAEMSGKEMESDLTLS